MSEFNDFIGFLTNRKEVVVVSPADNSSLTLLERAKELRLKHLAGSHDQQRHAWRYGGGENSRHSMKKTPSPNDRDLYKKRARERLGMEKPGARLGKEIWRAEYEVKGNKTGETAFILDKEGNTLLRKRGAQDHVGFTAEEATRMKGNVLTHNHPFESSFSSDDVRCLIKYKLGEMRAVTSDYRYSMKMKPRHKITVDKFKELVDYYNTWIQNETWDKIDGGRMTVQEAKNNHWHEVWSRMSQEHPEFIYSREAW